MSTQQIKIPASSLDFLKSLKENNNRDWFNARKDEFLEEQKHIEIFADALLDELNKTDLIETLSGKKSLHRIYRDTRFSKEKIPYKINWSGSFSRATKQLRGGYYFHIQPGNSFVAGGFQAPNPEDLKRIREDFSFDPAPIRKILNSKSFVDTFGSLKGEQIKTTPKGFDKNDEAMDLLRYKQFLLIKNFSDEEVLSSSFLKAASEAFKNMRPFFNYMSEVLSTDQDGLAL
ncbi:DUF2461 domain-containing protein [Dyadobacter sp. CY345]|uniref:DUF2461 domain-containing protein n=1 Tax=Dyadobacter sp. CY345 TaxID=2909335 RepID=UPI001F222AB0|nr:DUF2461 domain-containing protein [Dyadobacter sp. CY345]MCF2442396.1 DUF2461 domain-containing protein [Dyadobacter sp. CY345]